MIFLKIKILEIRFFMLAFIFSFNNISACNCIGKTSIKKEIKRSDLIIMGEIISKREFKIHDENLPFYNKSLIEYTILVKKIFKGKVNKNEIKIITGIGNGDCGVNFKMNSEYIIYAKESEKFFEAGQKVDAFFYTDICTRTKIFEKKEIRKLKRILKTG